MILMLFRREFCVHLQAQFADIVLDADGEMLLGARLAHFVEHGLHHPGSELLRGKAVAPADDARCGHAQPRFAERCHDVLIQRLADRARFLGAVEHGDGMRHARDGRQQVFGREGAVQTHLEHANLLAASQ
jgi:hypothetical protein